MPRLARDKDFETIGTEGAARSGAATDTSADTQQPLAILVVEDDPRVLRSTLAALNALGHEGIACDHPGKAAATLAQRPDIALILSDVLMPDLSGPEMIEALGSALAGRPVIFVTGFAGDQGTAAQIAGFPILRKPFTVAQLAAAITESKAAQRDAQPASPAI
jgi:CheY-like chemotaxis protein